MIQKTDLEEGAKRYERWNFRKGIPVSSFIDSACRHLAKYQCGIDDEDHLAAAAFNVLGAMLMEETKPEMIDLPLRKGKETFNYFENGTVKYKEDVDSKRSSMSILETANMLNEIAREIAVKRGITVQEAWEEALEELKALQEENKELQI